MVGGLPKRPSSYAEDAAPVWQAPTQKEIDDTTDLNWIEPRTAADVRHNTLGALRMMWALKIDQPAPPMEKAYTPWLDNLLVEESPYCAYARPDGSFYLNLRDAWYLLPKSRTARIQ